MHMKTFRKGKPKQHMAFAALAVMAVLTAGCASGGGNNSAGKTDDAEPTKVVLATHGSWAVPDEVVASFEDETGYELDVVAVGDAGELTNRLVLTKDNPIADAVFGIDNTFASRAVEEGVLAAYTPADLPDSVAELALDGEGGEQLTAIDWSDVCVNIDDIWFADNDVAPPATLDDLVKPAYQNLFVTPAASSSSPGFAFLLATIGEYGEDGWQDWWQRVLDNGARITSGWSDAYEVDFTAGGGDGDRPIVLSYSSSPPFTIPDDSNRPTTSALLDTCFRQVEYAGVLAGAANPDGAQALVDFLVGEQFQTSLPENMYVFPADDSVELPELWARWAEKSPEPIEVDPAEIAENRDQWIRDWSDVTSG